jgi:hypothetical protein
VLKPALAVLVWATTAVVVILQIDVSIASDMGIWKIDVLPKNGLGSFGWPDLENPLALVLSLS